MVHLLKSGFESFALMGEFGEIGGDNDVTCLVDCVVIGVNNDVVVPGVVGVDTKVLFDKVAAFAFYFLYPLGCLLERLFLFVFVGVTNANVKTGGDPYPQTFVGGNNKVSSPSDDHDVMIFAGLDEQLFEMIDVADVGDVVGVNNRVDRVREPVAGVLVYLGKFALGDAKTVCQFAKDLFVQEVPPK